jgi:hypothetical protein
MHFREWLAANVSEEAAAAFQAIQLHHATADSFAGRPVSALTRYQKRFITDAKKQLSKAADWLKVGVL